MSPKILTIMRDVVEAARVVSLTTKGYPQSGRNGDPELQEALQRYDETALQRYDEARHTEEASPALDEKEKGRE